MKQHQHGGKRAGSGRKYLDGSDPGQGAPAVRKTVTLSPEMVNYLTKLGDGNLSKGVRVAVRFYRSK